MSSQVITGSLQDPHFAKRHAQSMFRMRFRVFHERLQWEVKCSDGMESDQFDDNYSLYVVVAGEDGKAQGSWRLRPTTLPYMMADVPAFEPLLHGHRAPRAPRVWEISRFAVDTDEERSAFGLNRVARALVEASTRLAVDNGIDQYVIVVSVAIERLLKNLGLVLHRYGPAVRIGKVTTVACRIDVDAHTRHVILGQPLPAPIEDLKVAA
jgi:acyl homoserine lactone synthase